MLTRRQALIGAVAATGTAAGLASPLTAAAAPAGPLAHAPYAAGQGVPETLAEIAAPGQLVAAAEFPLDFVSVSWTGPKGGGVYRLEHNGRWGAWRPLVTGDADGRTQADPAGPANRLALFGAQKASRYEVKPPPLAENVLIVALNTTDGPLGVSSLSVSTSFATADCAFVNRAGWGADETLRFNPDGTERYPQAYFPVQALTVHHTAGDSLGPDHAATIRAIYYTHTITRDFGDIGYHLLIDPNGVVYEGRWSGEDGLPVFRSPLGDVPHMSNAAHAVGFNAANVGVSLLGDFTGRQPAAAQRRSLVKVLAALAKLCKVDPLGTVNYVNPISGATRTVAAISGHRDWNSTACPGDAFYPQLPSVRQEVARALRRR
ncbi:peptidoglycan recognition protein family protein [Kribbella deserti]|uniref:Peptidoglycan recognition family protein n=1 Tax=Kribbella deserti TaxID=1926257 RepID=A0ABV6QM13_9ACTN